MIHRVAILVCRPLLGPGISAVRTRWPIVGLARFATVVILSMGLSGCMLPLAVFPAPQAGSGMILRFRDESGAPISEDGLIVETRSYDGYLQLGPDSTVVVDITDGEAKLPDRITLAALWLRCEYYVIPRLVMSPGENVRLWVYVPGFQERTLGYSDFAEGEVQLTKEQEKQGWCFTEPQWERIPTSGKRRVYRDPGAWVGDLSESDRQRLRQFLEDTQ